MGVPGGVGFIGFNWLMKKGGLCSPLFIENKSQEKEPTCQDGNAKVTIIFYLI